MNPKDILIQILIEAKERGLSIGITQLVKLFYLTEVEYFRSNQERLTELRWLFYHYGPYAVELREVLNQPVFVKEEFKTRDDRDFVRCSVAEERIPYSWKLEPRISLLIKRIVGDWRDKSLQELLDYVYFETEPMQAVEKRGQVLDFSTVKEEKQAVVIPMKASKQAQAKARDLQRRLQPTLKRLAEQQAMVKELGEEYKAAMEAWDEDMGKEFDPDTLKNISLNISGLKDDPGR